MMSSRVQHEISNIWYTVDMMLLLRGIVLIMIINVNIYITLSNILLQVGKFDVLGDFLTIPPM